MAPPTKASVLWAKFDKSVHTGKDLSKTVHGLTGKHLEEFTMAMWKLGNGVYTNKSWNMDSADMDALLKQQATALATCHEMKKAMIHLISIMRHRMGEQQRKMADVHKKRLHDMNLLDIHELPPKRDLPVRDDRGRWISERPRFESADISPPFAQQGDAPRRYVNGIRPAAPREPLFDDSIPTEVKEVKQEIKEEPEDEWNFDEDGTDIKQEEEEEETEPMVDAFCPSTGASRPIDDVKMDESMDDVGTSYESREGSVRRSDRMYKKAILGTDRYGFLGKHYGDYIVGDPLDEVNKWNATSHRKAKKRANADSILTDFSNETTERIRCCLCEKLTDAFYSTPENLEDRRDFLNRIICLRPTHKGVVTTLMRTGDPAHFCHIHLATRMIPGEKKRPPPKLHPKYRSVIPRELPALKSRYIVMRDAPHLSLKCDLCQVKGYPYHFFPNNTSVKGRFERKFEELTPLQKRFMNNMKEMTPQERMRLELYIHKNQRATVCWRHMKELPPSEEDIDNEGAESSYQEDEIKQDYLDESMKEEPLEEENSHAEPDDPFETEIKQEPIE